MNRKVTVETREFTNSHGRNPKGFGCWMFAFGNNPDDMATWASFTGTFAEAKKQAVKVARSQEGVNTVHVLP